MLAAFDSQAWRCIWVPAMHWYIFISMEESVSMHYFDCTFNNCIIDDYQWHVDQIRTIMILPNHFTLNQRFVIRLIKFYFDRLFRNWILDPTHRVLRVTYNRNLITYLHMTNHWNRCRNRRPRLSLKISISNGSRSKFFISANEVTGVGHS